MSEVTSAPRAPKPRHHRTHTALRMSSSELAKHTARRHHSSITAKHRSASVDTVCGFVNCRHCSKARSLSPSPARTLRVEHHDRRPQEGMEKEERIVPVEKVSKPSHHKHHRASKAKKPAQRKSRHGSSTRPRSQVRNSSTLPPSSHIQRCSVASPSGRFQDSVLQTPSPFDYMHNQRRGYSPASRHIPRAGSPAWTHDHAAKRAHQGNKTHHHDSSSQENRFTRSYASQAHTSSARLETPIHERRSNTRGWPAGSPEGSSPYHTAPNSPSRERSPSASSQLSHVGSGHSWHSAASSISIPWKTLEKHAHCRRAVCTLRTQLDAKLSGRSRHKSPSLAATQVQGSSGNLQENSLDRPQYCTCPVYVSADSTPLRPEHEEPPEYFMKPIISIAQDGGMVLEDPLKGVYYQFSSTDPENPKAGFKIDCSGEFEPTEVDDDDTGLGFHCPCYDEVHGHGASARIIVSLREHERQEYVVYSFTQDILEAWPWMDKQAAEEKAREYVHWLGEHFLKFVRKNGWNNALGQFEGQQMFYGAQLMEASGWLEGN